MRARVLTVTGLIAMLAACGGGGTSPIPPAAPSLGSGPELTPAVTPMSSPLPAVITASTRSVNGLDNMFTPRDGDSSTGGQGQTVDGVRCGVVSVKYHVHAFLGLIVNGREWALPDAIGLFQPGTESNGFTGSAKCFYDLHTHDASGIIHMESASTAPSTSSLFTLGQFFAIWGQSTGTWTAIYTSGQKYGGIGSQRVSNRSYTKYGGTLSGIPLYSHEVIWLERGTPILGPAQLPSIQFTY